MAVVAFSLVESKWQGYWRENRTFDTPKRRAVLEDGTIVRSERKKKYVLDMFPYPSGAGLHVGHPEGYTGELSLDPAVDGGDFGGMGGLPRSAISCSRP